MESFRITYASVRYRNDVPPFENLKFLHLESAPLLGFESLTSDFFPSLTTISLKSVDGQNLHQLFGGIRFLSIGLRDLERWTQGEGIMEDFAILKGIEIDGDLTLFIGTIS